jgi:hypothetical protein
MLLTLETATIENGTYTWRFPKMKFSMCIKTYDVGIPISYNYIYKGTDKEISQLLIPPNFCPYTFEDEYFSIIFVKSPVDLTPLIPTELTIELTPVS